MQLVISLSFVKLLWPFERCISYSHDQDHVHSTYFTNFYTGSCARLFHPFHKIKTPCYSWLFSPNCKDMGCSKKNLDTWRSKVFKRERKEIWTHEGPMFFKRKIAHVQRNKREIALERSSYTIHKNSTHLHILIKVYDLFLLRIRSLT